MRKQISVAVVLSGFALAAAAQTGARLTLPTNSRQEGHFRFANMCPNTQTYRAITDPPVEWLHIESPTTNADSGTSFSVGVMVDSAGLRMGPYKTSLRVICASCAVSDPPCFDVPKDFPLEVIVANVAVAGEFEPIIPPPPVIPRTDPPKIPEPYVPPAAPPQHRYVFIPVVGGGLLLVAMAGMVFAMRALASSRRGEFEDASAESHRHHVRR